MIAPPYGGQPHTPHPLRSYERDLGHILDEAGGGGRPDGRMASCWMRALPYPTRCARLAEEPLVCMVRSSPHEPHLFTEQVDLSVQVVYAPDVHFGKSNGDGIAHDLHLKYVLASDPSRKEHCFKKALGSMQLQQESWKCALWLQCMVQAVV